MNGIINILKPPGMTSSDVVVDVRRALGIKKVGHTGTLDPGAAGVLPVCVGKATRLFDYIVDKEKEYLFEMHFGAETDTLDAYGKLTSCGHPNVSADEIESVLPRFIGRQEQIPPAYSSLKLNGKKLYELARQGKETARETKRRAIDINELELLEQTGERRFLLRVGCSRGTYVRVLCADIAEALGSKAYVSFLLRTRTGNFSLDNAHSLDELRTAVQRGTLSSLVTRMEDALKHLRSISLDSDQCKALLNGITVGIDDCEDGQARIYSGDAFIGVGSNQGKKLKLSLVLAD